MSHLKQNLAAILTLNFICLFAFAGNETSGGGGIAFDCGKNGLFSRNVYLADTYQILHVEKNQLLTSLNKKYSANNSERVILDGIVGTIYFYDAKFASILIANLNELNFVPGKKLDFLGDDDIKAIPAGCKKRQLAIQTFADNTVRYDANLYESLSHLERALFRLHEAYVKIYRSNSTTVRSHVAGATQNKAFDDFLKTALPETYSHECTDQQWAEANSAQGHLAVRSGFEADGMDLSSTNVCVDGDYLRAKTASTVAGQSAPASSAWKLPLKGESSECIFKDGSSDVCEWTKVYREIPVSGKISVVDVSLETEAEVCSKSFKIPNCQ